MVSPITIIDETSNSDDDEIVFMLNIDISIDGVDCDPEESDNDASLTTANTIEEVVPVVEEATTNTVEAVVPAVEATATSSTAAATTSSTAAASSTTTAADVEEAAKNIFDEAAAAIEKVANSINEEVTPKKQPSPPKRQPSPPKKQPSPPKRQPSPPRRQPSPPRRQPSPPRRQPSPPRRVQPPPPPPPKKNSNPYKPMAGNHERIYPRDAPHLSLAVRDGEVVLANKNSRDVSQHWIIYRRFSTGVKDVQGQATFSIANNGTGKHLQHAIGHNHPIRLIKHYFKEIDRSILWTSQQFADSSCAIRSVNDIGLELISASGNGYRDGIKALLYNFRGAGHHYWKITNW